MNSNWWMGTMVKRKSNMQHLKQSINNYNRNLGYLKEYTEYTSENYFHEPVPVEKTLAETQQERIEELEAKLRKFNLLTGRIKDGS